MNTVIAILFILGYFFIAAEHFTKINKAAAALLTGVLCWVFYILGGADIHFVSKNLSEHLSEISSILFFLMGAITIVELIDAHDGFQIITDLIQTTKARQLLWIVAFLAFFLSAILDNLTTTIVMVSLLKKLVTDKEKRFYFIGIVVIAANAGGAWYKKIIWNGNFLFSSFSGNVPYRMLPTLGGSKYLRGYYKGRFRDKNLILIQQECRMPLYKRLGIAVFGGVGEVASTLA
jgi:hypothetical protein